MANREKMVDKNVKENKKPKSFLVSWAILKLPL